MITGTADIVDLDDYYINSMSSPSAYSSAINTAIKRIPNNIEISGNYGTRLFYYCLNLIEIPNIDTSSIISASYMFSYCKSLERIPLLNLSSNTNASYMFEECESLVEVPLIDTSLVTSTKNMFYNCKSLQSIPALNLSNNLEADNMFNGCSGLISIPNIDFSNCTKLSNTFKSCQNLQNIPVFNFASVGNGNLTSMFQYCPNLTDESLNNIMASLITATNVTSNKTLGNVGLDATQRAKCQTLSNWEAFTNAGWTA